MYVCECVCRHICGYMCLYKSQVHFGTMREMDKKIEMTGTSLVAQWLRFHLPKQRVRVGFLVRKLRSHMP